MVPKDEALRFPNSSSFRGILFDMVPKVEHGTFIVFKCFGGILFDMVPKERIRVLIINILNFNAR